MILTSISWEKLCNFLSILKVLATHCNRNSIGYINAQFQKKNQCNCTSSRHGTHLFWEVFSYFTFISYLVGLLVFTIQHVQTLAKSSSASSSTSDLASQSMIFPNIFFSWEKRSQENAPRVFVVRMFLDLLFLGWF